MRQFRNSFYGSLRASRMLQVEASVPALTLLAPPGLPCQELRVEVCAQGTTVGMVESCLCLGTTLESLQPSSQPHRILQVLIATSLVSASAWPLASRSASPQRPLFRLTRESMPRKGRTERSFPRRSRW